MYTTKARNECEKTEISDKILKENISLFWKNVPERFPSKDRKRNHIISIMIPCDIHYDTISYLL